MSGEADKSEKRIVHHAMAVQTAEALHVLDDKYVLETGTPPQINRGLKGDRVIQPEINALTYAGIQTLTTPGPDDYRQHSKRFRSTIADGGPVFPHELADD